MALLNDAFTVPLLIFGKFTSFIIYTYALHAFKIWGLIDHALCICYYEDDIVLDNH